MRTTAPKPACSANCNKFSGARQPPSAPPPRCPNQAPISPARRPAPRSSPSAASTEKSAPSATPAAIAAPRYACGAGAAASFVCRYHAWAYALDGALTYVPHEHGFPGLDKTAHGLAPLQTIEHGGAIFITQDASRSAQPANLPTLLPRDLQLISATEQETHANWKIAAESFLEGYHIRSTHRETFYPVQFDNLNVIEFFGRNSRITFPYRNIEKLRPLPPPERRVAGTLTHVYHLFPNVMIATFPKRTIMVVLEPLGVASTNYVTYTLADAGTAQTDQPDLARDTVSAVV